MYVPHRVICSSAVNAMSPESTHLAKEKHDVHTRLSVTIHRRRKSETSTVKVNCIRELSSPLMHYVVILFSLLFVIFRWPARRVLCQFLATCHACELLYRLMFLFLFEWRIKFSLSLSLAKKVQLTLIGSPLRSFQCTYNHRTLPLNPAKGLKTAKLPISV